MGLWGRRNGQPGRGAFVSNSRSLGIAAIGRRSSQEERRPPIRAGASHSSASWNGHPGRRSALRPRTPWPTRMTKTSMTGQGSQDGGQIRPADHRCPAGRSRGAARRHSRRDGHRPAQRVTEPEPGQLPDLALSGWRYILQPALQPIQDQLNRAGTRSSCPSSTAPVGRHAAAAQHARPGREAGRRELWVIKQPAEHQSLLAIFQPEPSAGMCSSARAPRSGYIPPRRFVNVHDQRAGGGPPGSMRPRACLWLAR